MSLLSRLAVQAARAYGILSSNPNNVSADYLVVAGGGGGGVGGARGGGGGGAGGYLTSTTTLSTLTTYTITVGAGGAGGTAGSATPSGGNSSISGTGLTTITATGGGGGGNESGADGQNGGSGGGGSGATNGYVAGTGTSGQGNNGGAGQSLSANNSAAGGGGGAGAAGTASSTGVAGAGGVGLQSSISGTATYYAGGGGGSVYTGTSASGGLGGGGNGGSATGTAGTANTGGGGGGGSTNVSVAGGSGIVIISYTSATPKFVGGTITTSGGKQIHTFTSSGTLSPITPITASYLVVAGGGGGGFDCAGGGGAGGLQASSTTLYSGATYVVTVGAGGVGGTSGSRAGSDGSNTTVSGTGLTTLTSTGGGGGGGNGSASGGNGRAGGSGGGAGFTSSSNTGGAGTSGQGNNGGNNANNDSGAGGGGAGAAGANNTSGGTAGGIGATSSISGTSTYYAGGGGGSVGNTATPKAGGTGGGGASASNASYAVAGTTNTGGGGGAGNAYSATYQNGAAGGSGIVIISYAGSQVFNGGLVTSSGGNTIHTFTSTGALTPLTNNLNNSLRFRSSASAYLNRTPASASNRKTWTWSGWVKKAPIQGSANTLATLMGCTTGSTDSTYLRFGFYQDKFIVGNNSAFFLQSTPLYRDPSAWYHVVVSTDTNQGSASNRMRIYINGNEVTAWSTDQRSTYLTSSVDLAFNQASQHSIGSSLPNAGDYFDGYMTDINFIDGQALEPYYFGNNDANGVWKPILYKGTYGTNGFYLTFGNTTSTTTLGYDSSPNGNNWTCNNISLTAGTTYDAMTDVPTNTSATVANYATLNPLSMNGGTATLSNANLTFTNSNAAHSRKASTIGVTSGKWYAEATLTTKGGDFPVAGIVSTTVDNGNTYIGADTSSYGYASSGQTYSNTAAANYGTSFTTGDIIGIIYDADNGKLYFSKNGTIQNSGDPSAGTGFAYSGISGQFLLGCSGLSGTVWNINFGQRPFSYTPPTGYVALNTYNLPTPTILQGNKYMDATLYTGNSGSQTVSNGKFYPDLSWFKSRGAAAWNVLFDSVRGANSALYSNGTNAQDTAWTGQSFTSTGFTVSNSYSSESNYNGQTMVGWMWNASSGTTSSNTSGSITSTVSASTTAGFSIATFSSNSTNATIGHGLGAIPRMIIVKGRNNVQDWYVYHTSLGAGNYILLNGTGASQANTNVWQNTTPTSSVFYFGSSFGTVNYVAYCWAEIAGFSSFGSYTGNGSADGPFIYTGFRPKFIMIKRTNGVSGRWVIEDTSRDPTNVADKHLAANLSAAEGTGTWFTDFLSNGFKIRNTDSEENASGGTYIYMAFAENPFKNANAR